MFLQGLYVALLSWHNSHVGSTWFLVYYVGSWCGQVRSLKIPFSWTIEFLISLAVVCWWRFKRSCYFADCNLHDRVIFADRNLCDHVILAGPRFEPRAKQYNLFIGPGFNSQARSPVSGQCDSWPMSSWYSLQYVWGWIMIKCQSNLLSKMSLQQGELVLIEEWGICQL